MNIKQLVCLILISSVLALSCVKKKQIVYVPVDADILAHYNFNIGSYWIYKDSASGVADSFVVAEHHADTVIVTNDHISQINDLRFYTIIQQYHNDTLIDTTKWAISLENSWLTYTFSKYHALQIFLKDAEIIDTTFQGMPYHNTKYIKKYSLILGDDIGLIYYSSNFTVKELLRYRIYK